MRNQLLLLDDVDDLGRSGDIVSVKPGFARNFLIPKKKAVVADKFTLRMQAKLQEERAKRAEVDRKLSLELAQKIEGLTLEKRVKVDPDGNMYGSVSQGDIVQLFENEGIKLDKRNIQLAHPIKALGVYGVSLKLNEAVPARVTLKVVSETPLPEKQRPTEKQEPTQEEDEPKA